MLDPHFQKIKNGLGHIILQNLYQKNVQTAYERALDILRHERHEYRGHKKVTLGMGACLYALPLLFLHDQNRADKLMHAVIDFSEIKSFPVSYAGGRCREKTQALLYVSFPQKQGDPYSYASCNLYDVRGIVMSTLGYGPEILRTPSTMTASGEPPSDVISPLEFGLSLLQGSIFPNPNPEFYQHVARLLRPNFYQRIMRRVQKLLGHQIEKPYFDDDVLMQMAIAREAEDKQAAKQTLKPALLQPNA